MSNKTVCCLFLRVSYDATFPKPQFNYPIITENYRYKLQLLIYKATSYKISDSSLKLTFRLGVTGKIIIYIYCA